MTCNAPPIHTQNPSGNPRQVGFEFELAAIDTLTTAKLIQSLYGGDIACNHSLDIQITNTTHGTYRVELDAEMVKNLANTLEKTLPSEGIISESIGKQISEWLGVTAGTIVPCEIVTPPIPHTDIDTLDQLRKALHQAGATGTGNRWYYAFGMHINPEIASTSTEYLCNIMRAFLLLYPWLVATMKVNPSRRILTYIDPFPKAYALLVLNPNYQPNQRSFIADYLTHNPTRNRALDMLPLFKHLDKTSLATLPKEAAALVKARPTFHYRLPNCDIDNANWRISTDWQLWLEVEKLAEDSEKLTAMSSDYIKFTQKPWHSLSNEWLTTTKERYNYA